MRIGIIGAGASGLMAAITAAGQGADVTLIEKNDREGKKILATGNGKCNFTNRHITENDYHSQRKYIVRDYLGQFNEEDTISLFMHWGMMMKERDGYCYPRSEQATTVLGILKQQCRSLNIPILTNSLPQQILCHKKGFVVKMKDREDLVFDRLILACGSHAGLRQSEPVNGYTYAASFGHKIVPVVPSLVQVRAKEKVFKQVAGVRCQAVIQLYIEGKAVDKEEGELQLTDYGISGIPVFQLSRQIGYAALEGKSMQVIIDFLPELGKDDWKAMVESKWKNISKERNLDEFFQGFLNSKLNTMFIRSFGYIPEKKLKYLCIKDVLKISEGMKCWTVTPIDTNPFVNAQVCAGGISMDEVSLQMESKLIKGLFFCGEILDVDGRCGGYNLQWAWTSGYLAGKYAAAL